LLSLLLTLEAPILTVILLRAEQQIPCFVAVFDVDHILIYWTALNSASGYIRWREEMSNPLEDEVGNLPEYMLAQVDQQ
jgi:hypothetical protein